jgi:hypothetical protein
MNGEGQSRQPDDLRTAPEPTSVEQAQKAPTTPEPLERPQQTPATHDADKKAESQTSGGEARSKFRKVVKAVFSPIGALIAALVGFLLGIASTQVSDYVKRAGDCAGALEQYTTGVAANFGPTYYINHDPDASADKQLDLTSKYVAGVDAPYDKAVAICPLDQSRGTEYLDENKVKDFLTSYGRVDKCIKWTGCPEGRPEEDDNLLHIAEAAISSAKALTKEAQEVPAWGLVRRTKYVVMHVY